MEGASLGIWRRWRGVLGDWRKFCRYCIWFGEFFFVLVGIYMLNLIWFPLYYFLLSLLSSATLVIRALSLLV